MKAIYFNQHGELSNLEYGELPKPTLEPGYAIVKVKYAAFNHLDLWVLKGWKGLTLPLPHIGGADVSGTIEQIAPNEEFKENDLVCINPGIIAPGSDDKYIRSGREHLSPAFHILGEGPKGGFAQYVKIPISSLHKLPEMQEEELVKLTASLLVGVTSFRMLVDRAKLKAGETALVVGGGGGLNSFTIKFAKFLGAKVLAVTSTEEKIEFCKKIGADAVINYRDYPEWNKEVRKLTENEGVDIVIDNVGAATFSQSIKACKKEGRIVTVGNTSGHEITFDNRFIFSKQISILGSTMGSFKNFEDILKIILGQKLFAEVDQVLALSNGVKGYEILSKGEQKGKVILKP